MGEDPTPALDPKLRAPKLHVARRLLMKKLGFRTLLDVIPLEPELVRGSHGRLPDESEHGPVFLSSLPFGACGPEPADGVVEMAN